MTRHENRVGEETKFDVLVQSELFSLFILAEAEALHHTVLLNVFSALKGTHFYILFTSQSTIFQSCWGVFLG